MSLPIRIDYNATRGVNTSLANLVSVCCKALEETPDELFRVESCISSTPFETNVVAGITTVSLDVEAVDTYKVNPFSGSNYALRMESNETNVAGARGHIDLNNYYSYGDIATIDLYAAHCQSGGDWSIDLDAANTGTSAEATQLTSLNRTTNADPRRVRHTFVYTEKTRYLVFHENNASNAGGCIIDDLSLTKGEAIGSPRSTNNYHNLFLNPEFSSTAYWEVGDGGSITGGVCDFTGAQGAPTYLRQEIQGQLDAGDFFEVEFTISGLTAGTMHLDCGGETVGDTIPYATNGTYTATLRAGGVDRYFQFVPDQNFNGNIDSVYLRKSPNLIHNGGMRDSDGWILNSWTISGNQANLGGVSSTLIQEGTDFEPGEYYLIEFYINTYTAGSFGIASTGGLFAGHTNGVKTASGYYKEIYQATGQQQLQFSGISFNGSVTDIRITKVTTNHVSTDNSAVVSGGVLLTPFSARSNVGLYTGFTTNDTIRSEYNSNLNFGTLGSYSFGGQFRMLSTLGTDDRVMGFRGYHNGTNWIGSAIRFGLAGSTDGTTAGAFFIEFTDDAFVTVDRFETTTVYDTGLLYNPTVVVSGSTVYLYINGAINASFTLSNAVGNMDNTSAELYVGTDRDHELSTGKPFTDGEISNVWFHNAALTSADVKTKNNKEASLYSNSGVFQIIGQTYSLETYLTRFEPNEKVIGPKPQVSLDGSDETIVHNVDRSYALESSNISALDMPKFREFLTAAQGRAYFSIIPKNVYNPASLMGCKIVSNSYREKRVVETYPGEFSIAFRIKQ